MNEKKANELLDDISTDRKTLYSDKQILFLTNQHELDIPAAKKAQIINR